MKVNCLFVHFYFIDKRKKNKVDGNLAIAARKYSLQIFFHYFNLRLKAVFALR